MTRRTFSQFCFFCRAIGQNGWLAVSHFSSGMGMPFQCKP